MTDRKLSAAEAAAMIDDLPRLLRATREARNLSLRDVAADLNCGVATVYDVENGNHSPTARLAAEMLRWIGGQR